MVKTLIVDDSEVFRRSIRQLLSSRFRYMHIAEAANLHDAVEHAHAVRADLVFADIRLPDGTGLELARTLAATSPQSRVCIVTSFDLPEYRTAAQECGARHFLAKGDATMAEVVAVVDATLADRFLALIVDDDARRCARIAKRLTTRWPYMIVFEAVGAPAGLEMAAALKPALVLIRVSVLGADGSGLCPSIKAINAASTIVAIGRAVPLAERESALRNGADHAVAWNSGSSSDISRIVQSVLARDQAQRQRQLVPQT
jgi:DNA-binding NarL/FixJ family response regulator